WLSSLIKELWSLNDLNTVCYIDNSGLHDKIKFGNHHSKTKYLDTKAKWITNKFNSLEIKIKLIKSEEMIADCLTKASCSKTNLHFLKVALS
ncbi:hypothetical protein PPACK8108_LOCUS25371, partial [Phakopsora pachyrhizi]